MRIYGDIAGEYKSVCYGSTLVTSIGFASFILLVSFFSLAKSGLDSAKSLSVAIFITVVTVALELKRPFMHQLKQVVEIGQPDFVEARKNGITLVGNDGLSSRFQSWDSIADVVLTRKFRIVDSHDGLKCHHLVIIFLSRDAAAAFPLDLTKSGIAVSASGRLYLSADFSDGDWRRFEHALRKFAPDWIGIKVCSSVVFDRQTGMDDFAGIS